MLASVADIKSLMLINIGSFLGARTVGYSIAEVEVSDVSPTPSATVQGRHCALARHPPEEPPFFRRRPAE
jgi:hypothetical protein